MGFSDALSELNDSVSDYFGETVDYVSADGNTTVSDIEDVVVDYMDPEGEAMLDLPIASVSSPGVGAKITLDDLSEWYIYDYSNVKWGYTPCDIRSADYWQVCTLEHFVGNDYEAHTTGLAVYFAQATTSEFLDGETANVESTYPARCMFLTTPTEKMRLKVGTEYYYIVGIEDDASQERYLDLSLSKREF